jgi:hypothetical protein
MSFDPTSIASLWRLTFRLLVVAAFATLWPGEATAKTTALLCYLLAAGCLVAAIAFGERWAGLSLNRWHEAVVLLMVGTVMLL